MDIERILFGASLFSTAFLIITFLQMLLNRRDFRSVKASYIPFNNTDSDTKELLISVCIPMRNEEDNAKRILPSLLKSSDKNVEILILDDQSEDSTWQVLSDLANRAKTPLTLIKGTPKPSGWLGKPWACHQLSQVSKGDILLFLDADTVPSTDFFHKIRHVFKDKCADSITIWPEQELSGFWQKTALPLVYYALLTLLPFRYIRRKPRWMPEQIYTLYRHRFSAANGQCIAFRKSVYDQIGGHQQVKDQIVEDVAMARNVRKHNFKLHMFPGTDWISCRMYRSEKEMNHGFRKNFLAGFDGNIPLFLMMALLHLAVFILPYLTLIWAVSIAHNILIGLSVLNVMLIFTSRMVLNGWFNWSIWQALSHPLGVLWFQKLGVQILWDQCRGRKTVWKGREIQ